MPATLLSHVIARKSGLSIGQRFSGSVVTISRPQSIQFAQVLVQKRCHYVVKAPQVQCVFPAYPGTALHVGFSGPVTSRVTTETETINEQPCNWCDSSVTFSRRDGFKWPNGYGIYILVFSRGSRPKISDETLKKKKKTGRYRSWRMRLTLWMSQWPCVALP